MRRYSSTSVNAACQRSSTTIEHTGPSKLPRFGQSRRVRHGVMFRADKKDAGIGPRWQLHRNLTDA
jgi:hypothetical protein